MDHIVDDQGVSFTEEEDIGRILSSFYQNLFASSSPNRVDEAVEVVKNRISDEMRAILDERFTEEEVYCEAKNLKAHSAPGPDGMPAIFFQQFWSIVGRDITSFALNVLNDGVNPGNINHTFICLIPKKKKPKVANDFRPISLCNVICKIISKTIANRLKIILSNIIGKFQSAFVPGRLTTDNALVAFESFHWLRKKKW